MTRHLPVAALLAASLLLGVTRPAAALSFNVQDVIDPTGNNFINLLGINNSGTIAGFDNNAPAQGFTLTLPSNFTTENFPGAVSSMVTGINSLGDTTGIYTDAAGNTHGFVNVGGTFTTVDNPASTVFNQSLGINTARTTVGYFAPTQAGTTGQVAYSQSHGAFTNINALLPSNANSQAVGINDLGRIVGFYQPTSLTSIGFLDVGGVISTIDPFSSLFTQALGINAAGDIVGFYVDGLGVQHGYVDEDGTFISFDPAGSTNTTINGINDLGQIVGFFSDPNGNTVGFVGDPLPEPMSLTLLGVGLVGLAMVRRRRAKA
jgi:hypothetical protein